MKMLVNTYYIFRFTINITRHLKSFHAQNCYLCIVFVFVCVFLERNENNKLMCSFLSLSLSLSFCPVCVCVCVSLCSSIYLSNRANVFWFILVQCCTYSLLFVFYTKQIRFFSCFFFFTFVLVIKVNVFCSLCILFYSNGQNHTQR